MFERSWVRSLAQEFVQCQRIQKKDESMELKKLACSMIYVLKGNQVVFSNEQMKENLNFIKNKKEGDHSILSSIKVIK